MSKGANPFAIIIALALGFSGLSVASIWLVDKFTTGSISRIQNNTKDPTATSELRVMGNAFSGYSTVRSQDFSEALKKDGFTLHYENELDFSKLAERLNKGEADIVLTTLDQLLKYKTEGKIVGIVDTTVGADAVVLNTKKYPNLKSLVDLSQLVQQAREKGEQLGIAFAGDTPSEYLAMLLSSKFQAFQLSDFQISKVPDAADAWKMLQDPNQNVAVAVIWEPYVSQARQNGYTVVLSSKDAPGAILDVIVASDRTLQSQPEKISQFLTNYYRFIDAGVRNPSQLQVQVAEDGKLSPADAAAVVQGIDFFTSVESQEWLKNGSLEKRINSTAAVLTLAGQRQHVPQNSSLLYTSELITNAADNTKNLINVVRTDNPELAKKLEGKQELAANANVNPNEIQNAPDIGNLQVEEVKFETDASRMTNASKQTLNKLAEHIAEFNEQTVAVRVIGHTSGTGNPQLNQSLSQERAQVVADFLRQRGLKHKIVAEGKGSSQPIPSIPVEDRRNQRTEIRLVRLK
jgi:outer membrane protein OmpA-like peptidoglycan-associated protein/ABC-type nitrate/sulfonate/bicarbonate transport system substrate-binding protein